MGEIGATSKSINVSPNVFGGKTASILSWSPPENKKEKNEKTSSSDSKAEGGPSTTTHIPKGKPKP